jgi:hypothetical protein
VDRLPNNFGGWTVPRVTDHRERLCGGEPVGGRSRVGGRQWVGWLAVAAALAFLSLPAVEAAVVGGPAGAAPAAATATGSSVLAWGVNNAGQLGDGTTTERLAPVKVSLPKGVTVTSVRTSCAHTLALTRTGQVLAWGDNQWGQPGDGTTTERSLPVRGRDPFWHHGD